MFLFIQRKQDYFSLKSEMCGCCSMRKIVTHKTGEDAVSFGRFGESELYLCFIIAANTEKNKIY